MSQGMGEKHTTKIESGIHDAMSQSGTKHTKKQTRSINSAMGQGA